MEIKCSLVCKLAKQLFWHFTLAQALKHFATRALTPLWLSDFIIEEYAELLLYSQSRDNAAPVPLLGTGSPLSSPSTSANSQYLSAALPREICLLILAFFEPSELARYFMLAITTISSLDQGNARMQGLVGKHTRSLA